MFISAVAAESNMPLTWTAPAWIAMGTQGLEAVWDYVISDWWPPLLQTAVNG